MDIENINFVPVKKVFLIRVDNKIMGYTNSEKDAIKILDLYRSKLNYSTFSYENLKKIIYI